MGGRKYQKMRRELFKHSRRVPQASVSCYLELYNKMVCPDLEKFHGAVLSDTVRNGCRYSFTSSTPFPQNLHLRQKSSAMSISVTYLSIIDFCNANPRVI